MPLQNRVTPLGTIVATTARGTLMGNRGRLHDAERRLRRTSVPGYRAWVTCQLEFRRRRRRVMTPGRYTELFFLDEATALAAGHRPCGECRRGDLRRFKIAWARGNPRGGVRVDTPIAALDRVLHADRLTRDGQPRRFPARLSDLPDGTFILLADRTDPLLVWQDGLWPWTLAGYRPPRSRATDPIRVAVLTPRSTVAALAAGYRPALHPTATADGEPVNESGGLTRGGVRGHRRGGAAPAPGGATSRP